MSAGFAGLTAGWWLATHGFDVTILEARKRIGGCVHTKRGNQLVFECGGELIGRKPRQLASARQLFGLGLSPITTEENHAAADLKSPMRLGGEPISVSDQEKLYDEMKGAPKTLAPLAAESRR